MKRIFRIENLDCANCAAKMERAIAKIEGVGEVSIAFMTERITIDADDARFDEIVDKAEAACRKVDRDVRIVR